MGLRIAPDLELPVDVAGESTAILAKKGAGKSNTAKVIVEETLDHGGIQVVVLDPIGHWWSLRAGADGKPKGGYPVAVFGGMHGDLPLEETAGKLLAQTVVESGQSVVLDVSSLESNGSMQRFVYELLEELYRLKQATPTPLLLVLEEADEFAPQDPKGANVPRMVGAANRISKRGRGRGIGMLYVTQRSAALNKNVLDQADTLIVMRTIGPRDRKAIEEWVKYQDAQGIDEILPSLPSLETGEAWIWSPQRNVLQRVQVRKARTYDSSWTPRAGDAKVVVNVKPIDVDQLGHAIAATVERAKENDPTELRKRIKQLERAIADAPTVTTIAAEPIVQEIVVQVPVSAITRAHLEPTRHRLLDMREAIENGLRELEVLGDEIDTLPTEVKGARNGADQARARAARPDRSDAHANRERAERPRRGPDRETSIDTSAQVDGISGPQQKLLNALAWFHTIGVDQPRRSPVAAVAGVSPKSSGFEKNASTLRTRGLVDYPYSGLLQLTVAGHAAAIAPDEIPSADELHQAVCRMVSGPQATLLRILIDAHGEPVSREELADHAGVSMASSGFEKNVSTLKSFELAYYPDRGYVAAADLLFPDGAL